jgi:ubiquinone/menaquinone biosynthesis C-methylase UbiE
MTDGYEGRIGRYCRGLAHELIQAAGVRPRQRVLDVGCGSGALTEPLAQLVGAEHVVGIDPDPEAIDACRARVPDVDVRVGSAETLPFENDEFDAVFAQLVVGLLTDAAQGVAEMRRVARPGAAVATCVWDFGGGMTVLRAFWDAAVDLDSRAAKHDQTTTRPYSTREELHALWDAAGLRDVSSGALVVGADYRDFDDLWHPLVAPDGAPGRYYEALDDPHRDLYDAP